MDKTQKYHIWIILISGLLVALVFNFNQFSRLIDMIESVKGHGHGRGYYRLDILSCVFVFHVIFFYVFAFLNLYAEKYFSVKDKTLIYNILIVVLINILLYCIINFAQQYLMEFMFCTRNPATFKNYIFSNAWIVLLAISFAYVLILWQKNKYAEIEKMRLKEEKKNAELTALKDQISPHFFFNTLSSLSNVVRNESKDEALEFIQEISKTFRYTLANRDADLITLREEMDFVKSYLFLMTKRFGDKLVFDILVGDREYLKFVPVMSIQLLIENAVNHNIITQINPLYISIYIEEDMICVKNNFTPKSKKEGIGMGLKNLSNRYSLLSGKNIIIQNSEEYFIIKLPLL